MGAPRRPPRAATSLADLYDLTTYYGRLQYNWRRMNPLQLRWSAAECAGERDARGVSVAAAAPIPSFGAPPRFAR